MSADSKTASGEMKVPLDNVRAELEAAQNELALLTARQQRLADLLKCTPDRLEHDLRNVLNELQLLRTIFENEEKKQS